MSPWIVFVTYSLPSGSVSVLRRIRTCPRDLERAIGTPVPVEMLVQRSARTHAQCVAGHTNAHDPLVAPTDDVVTLRLWSRDDAGFIAHASADPAIRRYSGPHDRRGHPSPPLSITDAEAAIAEFAANWRAFAATGTPSGVAFAIADVKSGEVAGMCGVDQWSTEDVAQVGYWLAASARGRGYATRALVLLTRWSFELGAARVFLTIVAGNEASVGVARRAGFVHEGTMRSHGVWQDRRCDVMWFAALPPEWTVDGANEHA
jgi:RimJ/RimL family protein N-acetyltransferase